MNRTILFLIPLLIAFGCEKQANAELNGSNIVDQSVVNVQSDSVALSNFAQLLSRAINEEEALRNFIKEEALKQYDNDYDVFYAWVKDKKVTEEQTFEQILEKYDDNNILHSCVKSVPKITILVPDWAWLDAFSVKEWDTSENKVLVGYEQNGDTHNLFMNDETLVLEAGEFPEQPTLIVKNNERMVMKTATKADNPEFDYASQEFIGALTKGRAWYEDYIDLNAEIISDFVPKSDIDAKLISAFDKFTEDAIPEACQRDYIYYGMSKENPNRGILNPNIRDRFYRFKVEPDAFCKIADSDEDPKLHETIEEKGRKNQLDASELRKRIWSGGNFDLRFEFYSGDTKEMSTSSYNVDFNIPANKLFDLSRVKRRYKKQTGFAKGVYKYYFEAEDLVSKWYYPAGYQYAPAWDIFEQSNSLLVCISEIDPDVEENHTESWTHKTSKNFKWDVAASGEGTIGEAVKVKLSFGLGGDKGTEATKTTTITRKYSTSSDNLSSVSIPFNSKVIDYKGQSQINGEMVDGYYVRPVSMGQVSITLLPMDIR